MTAPAEPPVPVAGFEAELPLPEEPVEGVAEPAVPVAGLAVLAVPLAGPGVVPVAVPALLPVEPDALPEPVELPEAPDPEEEPVEPPAVAEPVPLPDVPPVPVEGVEALEPEDAVLPGEVVVSDPVLLAPPEAGFEALTGPIVVQLVLLMYFLSVGHCGRSLPLTGSTDMK